MTLLAIAMTALFGFAASFALAVIIASTARGIIAALAEIEGEQSE
jgi:hypothetical protein